MLKYSILENTHSCDSCEKEIKITYGHNGRRAGGNIIGVSINGNHFEFCSFDCLVMKLKNIKLGGTNA